MQNLYNKLCKLKNKVEGDIMRLEVKNALFNEDLQNVESKYCNYNYNMNNLNNLNNIIMLNNEIKENKNLLAKLNKQLEFINSELDILLLNSIQVNEQINQYGNQFNSIHNKLINFNKEMQLINSNINDLMARKNNLII